MAVHPLNPPSADEPPYRWVRAAGRDYVQTRTGLIIGIKHERRTPSVRDSERTICDTAAPVHVQSADADFFQAMLLDRGNRPRLTEHWILDVMDGPHWWKAFAAAIVLGALLGLFHKTA